MLDLPRGKLLARGLSLAVVHGRGSLQGLAELLQTERTGLSGHLDGEAHLVDAGELRRLRWEGGLSER